MISFSSGAVYRKMTILLFGEDLDPHAVSAALGIPATKSFKKGAPDSRGQHIRKSGMWSLDLNNGINSPSEDLRKFVDAIPRDLVSIFNVDGVTSGRLSLWIDSNDPTITLELSIDPQDIELMNKLGIQFYLTVFPEIVED
jgi:hypothetical protein